MNLFHFKIGGTVFSSNYLHTKWFSWCLLKILIRNSRRGASVRIRISNFSSKEFSLGEPFILIYIFPGKWWNFDLNKQGGRGNLVTSKNGNVKEQIFLNGSDNMVKRLKWMSGVAQNWWKHSLFFLRRIFPKNVGQEDPTVWIGYIFMIAISLFHSRISIYCFLCRMTFCREFLWENFFGQNFLLQSIFWQMTQSVIWVVNGTQIKALVTFAYDLLMLTENFWQKKW